MSLGTILNSIFGKRYFGPSKYTIFVTKWRMFHLIWWSSIEMASNQKFDLLIKIISKKFFSKIFKLMFTYKSYLTIKIMFFQNLSCFSTFWSFFRGPGGPTETRQQEAFCSRISIQCPYGIQVALKSQKWKNRGR